MTRVMDVLVQKEAWNPYSDHMFILQGLQQVM